ncbi:helix-turn-helix domain-containing protein [Streptomyces sp. NBC_00536]|uniref:helix-turn-helix domain-containing protein n=1 Tax=Streptomyces sp. NBC_00536 TaxID=2975769 RepID=UPI002E81EA7E|nr:helix-turn-helix transcriptional regulator [Streptomyces sp. NBC_00536]WUC83484.1 helix-turn-helix domain-containing protein [Streptomyces sp. NBC_00536]
MDSRRIGANIACWRGRRRLTQNAFGALMGKSKRWVQDLEAGSRQADPRLSVLEAAARVLTIPLAVLLADTPDEPEDQANEMEAIRAVLARHDIVTGTPDTNPADPLDVETLRRAVHHAWRLFQSSAAFTSLGGRMPGLLTDATQAAALHRGDDQLAAYRALSMSLQLTEALAIKAGAPDVAALAGHRAVLAAERSGDPVIQASAARHLADALTADGQPHAAAAFAQTAATRLADDLTTRGPAGLSTLGMLYLKAAIAQATAATLTDRRAPAAARAVPDLLDQADEHAAQLPPDADGNALFTAFSSTNVALYRVATHVRLYEGAAGAAVAQAITADERAALPRERRAHLLTDLAHAYTQAGQREKAVDTLLDAEREAPEEVLGRPRTHQLVQDLRLLGTGSAEGRLRALAERCGLPA